MNHIVPIASRYEAMLLDKVYKMAQIGGLDASADIDLLKKIQGHTAAIQTLTIEMTKRARRPTASKTHARRRSPTTTRWRSTSRRSAATSTSSKRSSTTRCGRCPNIGNFCSSNRFRNFQSGCEDAAEAFPRRFFLQPTPPEQPRHNEPLPMPASDSVRRTFRNLPAPLCEVDLSFSRTLRIRQNVLRAAEAEEDRCNMPVRRNRRGVFGQTDPIIRDFFLHLFEYFRPVRRSRPRTAPRIENETP